MNLLQIIGIIPGASSVVAELQSKVGDFLKIPSRIQNDQTRASRALSVAQTKNDSAGISELSAIQGSLPNLMNLYNNTLPLVQQITGEAGSISTDLLSGATDLAVQVTSLITSMDKIDSTLSTYEKKYAGLLPTGLFSSFTGLSATGLLWIAGGTLTLVFGYMALRRRA